MKYLFVALILMLFVAVPAFSQASPPPVSGRINPDRIRQQDISNREWQLRNFGKEPGRPTDRRQVEALMKQTEEDFNRILFLHNEIAHAISSNNDLNYQFVSDATGEIKKRASRVQSSLHLAPEEGRVIEKSQEFNDSQMKDALIKLCKQIRSFVTNPSIENPGTVDAKHLTKARGDLESVIQLSGQINKLSKNHK